MKIGITCYPTYGGSGVVATELGVADAAIQRALSSFQGIERRLDKLPENPARDAANMAIAQRVEQAYQQAVAELRSTGRASQEVLPDGDLREARWMLEELRVSLFAQTLGTLAPVSENRVMAALRRLST